MIVGRSEARESDSRKKQNIGESFPFFQKPGARLGFQRELQAHGANDYEERIRKNIECPRNSGERSLIRKCMVGDTQRDSLLKAEASE